MQNKHEAIAFSVFSVLLAYRELKNEHQVHPAFLYLEQYDKLEMY